MHGGDLTRSTFDPTSTSPVSACSRGACQLDADWNEQLDIATHRDRADIVDTVGDTGAPKLGGGFELAATADGTDLLLSPGRMWVGGTLCELDAEATPAEVDGDDGHGGAHSCSTDATWRCTTGWCWSAMTASAGSRRPDGGRHRDRDPHAGGAAAGTARRPRSGCGG